ncbi:H/ACA ribonucleoprotein complex subunit GAR1 [Methanocaldococcus sp.]
MRIKVLHKTPKGFVIGRGNAKIGDKVYYRHKLFGTVVDIFGPVAKPYVKIKPINKDLVPEAVFIEKSKYKNYKNKK